MKNILGYLKKHKWIFVALGVFLVIGLVLIFTFGNKMGNEPKVIGNISCPALNDVKISSQSNTLILTNSGDLYELSEKKYSNETNCKKLNEDIKITGIYFNRFRIATAFSEAKVYDISNSELIEMEYQKPLDIRKMEGKYILKDNGIIYKYKKYDLSQGTISDEEEFLKFDDEKILDFGIANGEINYVKTDKAYYTKKLVNERECTEYVDVECKYKLYKDNYLTKNYDEVAGFAANLDGSGGYSVILFKNGDVVDYDLENIYRLDEKTNVDVTYDTANSEFTW